MTNLHRVTPSFAVLLTVMLAVLWLSAVAHGQHCQRCGKHALCEVVCRLVCEEKKVELTCWGCKDELFCIPLPSHPQCTHCDVVDCQGTCGEKTTEVRSGQKTFAWTEWRPQGAFAHTKRRLMKKTTTRKVPTYRWEIEQLCSDCEMNVQPVVVGADVELPEPPIVNARMLYSRSTDR